MDNIIKTDNIIATKADNSITKANNVTTKVDNIEIYDMIIIGAGPAGVSSAIYAKRAGLKMIIIEQNSISGGQIMYTQAIDNYPGLMGINGYELGLRFNEQLKALGIEMISERVTKVITDELVKKVITDNKVYSTKTIIFATGSRYKKLGIDGEERLAAKGVSYCATCDGAFYKDKEVIVAGGGNVAVQDAIYLSKICKKVYLIHRRSELRADKVLQNKLFDITNVEILWNCVITSINGDDRVESVTFTNNEKSITSKLQINGIFIAAGMEPATDMLMGKNVLNSSNYVIAGEDCASKIPGIYAAGDIRTKSLRQIVTAISDGANAVQSAHKYLNCL